MSMSIEKCEIASNSVFSAVVSTVFPTVVSTVIYIPTREEDFDPAKSRFPDAKGQDDFKEKLGNDRKEKGEEARPYVCVLQSTDVVSFVFAPWFRRKKNEL